jgi:integrase/recombinase XerD
MKPKFTTAIIVDDRYPRKKDGKSPVKLRVIIDRKARYYGVGEYLTPDELTNRVYILKPRGDYKKLFVRFTEIKNRADAILETMETPTFDQFKRLFLQKGSGGNVKKYFDTYINTLTIDDQPGTASNYDTAKKSIDKMMGIDNLNFRDITKQWLKDYQKKMQKAGKSITTVSMYLRTLRTLYNQAIRDNVVLPIHYPFGRDKFQIPSARNYKRPLERWEIEALAGYQGKPINEMYRDYFLLSYSLMGLNFADLLTLQWNDIKQTIIKNNGETITVKYLEVLRKKTEHTSQGDQQKIEIEINDYAQYIIDKYGDGNKYVFSIITPGDTPGEQRRKIKNFVRNTNQALKLIAGQIGINKNISTMFARHSAAVHGLEGGATIGDVSHALGHKDLKTTSNYIKSMEGGKHKLAQALKITVPEQEHATKAMQPQ